MDLYAENILDHYRHPRSKKRLRAHTVSHEEVNHSCGDAIQLDLQIEGGKVVALGWDGTGCAISQASMSILSEELVGKSEEEIDRMTQKDIYELLGVPIGPRRFKCALLSLYTLKNALRKAHGKKLQEWTETVALTEE
ncbi:iron-sulfur cluster assembly scaffold protein [Candidatus Peregrinibacteria bacterium]|nr:iron-sulfur cluster assembly scaffold protein [Candidatus Peregrinibacteria bacterium]